MFDSCPPNAQNVSVSFILYGYPFPYMVTYDDRSMAKRGQDRLGSYIRFEPLLYGIASLKVSFWYNNMHNSYTKPP